MYNKKLKNRKIQKDNLGMNTQACLESTLSKREQTWESSSRVGWSQHQPIGKISREFLLIKQTVKQY